MNTLNVLCVVRGTLLCMVQFKTCFCTSVMLCWFKEPAYLQPCLSGEREFLIFLCLLLERGFLIFLCLLLNELPYTFLSFYLHMN